MKLAATTRPRVDGFYRMSVEAILLCGRVRCFPREADEGASMQVALIIGFLLSPLAAIMAFVITYEEYRRHFPERRRVIRAALETAVVTLVFFLLLSLGSSFLLGRFAR